MSEETADVSPVFVELIFQLQSAAWIHMGKVANPGTGKIERNLDMARGAIDMLGMIEEKTRGNLSGDEERLLRELLSQVRLNFVSEQDKPDGPVAAPADTGNAEDTDNASDSSTEAASESKAASPDGEAAPGG